MPFKKKEEKIISDCSKQHWKTMFKQHKQCWPVMATNYGGRQRHMRCKLRKHPDQFDNTQHITEKPCKYIKRRVSRGQR